MSIFDAIAKSFKAPKTADGGNVFELISKNLKQSLPGKVVKASVASAKSYPEFARRTGGALKDIGQTTARSFLSAGQALSSGSFDTKFTPSNRFEKAITGTDQPFNFKSEGEDVIKTVGGTDKFAEKYGLPLGIFMGSLDIIPIGGGGKKKLIEETADLISKTKSETKIFGYLKKALTGSDKELKTLSSELSAIDDPKVIKETIQNLTDAGKKASAKQILESQDDNLLLQLEEVRPKFDEIRGGKIDLDGGAVADEAIDALRNNKMTPELRQQAYEALKLIDSGIDKERGFVTTVKQSGKVGDEVKSQLKGTYTPITNANTISDASRFIESNIDEAYRIAKSARPASAFDNSVSQLLVTKLARDADLIKLSNPAQAKKMYDDVAEIVENLARKATEQGQAIQALSMFNRLSPEGVLVYAQRQINKANDLIKNPAKHIKLAPEKAQDLIKTAERIQKLPEGEEKLVETATMLRKIEDLLPKGILAKVSATQTIFQLLNPKTIIRNIGGNTGFAAAEQVSDVVGSILDTPLSLITGKRSKTLPAIGKQLAGAGEGFRAGIRDALKGIDTSGVMSQFDLPKTEVFKGKVGKSAQKLLNTVLKGPDRAFYQAAYDGSLANQMKAAGVSTPTEAMKEVAHFDGLYRTFQDENAVTKLFTGLKKLLNLQQEFGFGDLVLKYPKTPANLLNRGLAYSPVGFVGSVLELAKPLFGEAFNQKKFIERTSRALVGSGMLFGSGALLHKLGIVTTAQNEDKDAAQVERQTGLGQFKINTSALKRFVLSGFDPDVAKLQKGDTLVSYDWFQPNALSLAMGADFDKNKGSPESLLTNIIRGVSSGSETLATQPLISGFTNLFKFGGLPDAVIRGLQNLPASFIPTFMNQIRQLKDNTVRNTYSPDTITYALNLAKTKIPGISETLQPKYGSFGDEQEIYQGGANLFNVFFNPAFVTKYKPTPEAQMVLDIYNNTGEKKQLPNVVSTTQTISGESRKLTPNELASLQRYVGTVTKQIFGVLAKNPDFMAQSDEDKAKALSEVLTDIGAAGKIIFLGHRPKRSPGPEALSLVQAYMEQNQDLINSKSR